MSDELSDHMGALAMPLILGDGLRCAGGATFRSSVGTSSAGGTLSYGPGLVLLTNNTFPPAGQINAGATWHFQAWYRDPQGPCATSFNLSNGASVAFVP